MWAYKCLHHDGQILLVEALDHGVVVVDGAHVLVCGA